MRRLRAKFAARPGGRVPPMLLVTAYSHQVEIDTVSHEIDGLLAKPVSARHLYVELARCTGIAVDEKQPVADRRKLHALQWARFRHLDILLVEDTEINQEVIVELLASVGLRARLASNGQEAIEAVKERIPDLMLMDCQMPIMDGYEATRHLRADPVYRNLPIIALTANVSAEDQEKCYAAGMNAHVAKPILMETLYEKMTQCLPDVAPAEAPASTSSQGVTTVPSAAQDSTALPDFPGIDIAAGLAHVNGKSALLLRVFKQFRDKQGKNFAADYATAQASADWKTQHRLAHSLKGVASTLGATTLAEDALALQTAAEEEDAAKCALLLPALIHHLNIVVAGLADLDTHLEKL